MKKLLILCLTILTMATSAIAGTYTKITPKVIFVTKL